MTTTTKPFVVILAGQFPSGHGKYIVKRSENIQRNNRRIVSYHETFEEAQQACGNVKENTFSIRRNYIL